MAKKAKGTSNYYRPAAKPKLGKHKKRLSRSEKLSKFGGKVCFG